MIGIAFSDQRYKIFNILYISCREMSTVKSTVSHTIAGFTNSTVDSKNFHSGKVDASISIN